MALWRQVEWNECTRVDVAATAVAYLCCCSIYLGGEWACSPSRPLGRNILPPRFYFFFFSGLPFVPYGPVHICFYDTAAVPNRSELNWTESKNRPEPILWPSTSICFNILSPPNELPVFVATFRPYHPGIFCLVVLFALRFSPISLRFISVLLVSGQRIVRHVLSLIVR